MSDSSASESMACSMPLPGPRRPQVSNCGRSPTVDSLPLPLPLPGASAAPWGTTSTPRGSTMYDEHSLVLAVSVITTTLAARAHTASSTVFWWSVGTRGTVCSTTMAGASSASSNCSTSSPSSPPKMPYSCWMITASHRERMAAACRREGAEPFTSSPATVWPIAAGSSPSLMRTTSTRWPASRSALVSAAAKVASPQSFGG